MEKRQNHKHLIKNKKVHFIDKRYSYSFAKKKLGWDTLII